MSELPIVKRLLGINREVKSNGYCDRIRNPDGAEAAALIIELVAALEPFAKLESSWDASKHDWMEIERHVNVGWIRRARAAIEKARK